MKEDIYISLGSNEGNRLKILHRAIRSISLFAQIQAHSAVYETPPWGFDSDQPFLNAVIQIACKLKPEKLLEQLLIVEKENGRHRDKEKPGYKDRPLDLDILIYGEQVISKSNLHIPHPRMKERKFVLAPLKDIAPNLVPPGEERTITELFKAVDDKSQITKTHYEL